MSISSDDDTHTTESHSKYDSQCDPDVDLCMEDDENKQDGIDIDCDVDMERDDDNYEEEDEEEEDEEEEDEDEDDGKEPRTTGQGEMVNPSANAVDTMVEDQPIVRPNQGQETREHSSQQQPPAPAPWPQTPELRP